MPGRVLNRYKKMQEYRTLKLCKELDIQILSLLSYSRTSLEQQKKTSVMLSDTNSNSVLNSNSTTYNSHSTNETTGSNITCSSNQNAIYNGNFNFKNFNPAMSGLFTNATINGGHFSFNTYTGTNTSQQSSVTVINDYIY